MLQVSYAANFVDYLLACGLDLFQPTIPRSVQSLVETCYLNSCLCNKDRLNNFITRRNVLTHAELHDMFALVASRLLGDAWEVCASKDMRMYTLGMVTHMRPISLPLS